MSILFYGLFAYNLERTDIPKLLILWSGLFIFAYQLVEKRPHNTLLLGLIALSFRLLFLPILPNLSQDFYRFIWDGRMLIAGYNPYLYLPESLIANNTAPIAEAQELYQGMGALNGSHYTNYPPISQFCYAIAALFAGKNILGSVIIMRTLLILADAGIFVYGRKLLKALGLPENRIFWYLLNPFIIIELTGNLHFEGLMVFFIVWSLYFLQKKLWYRAAICLAFGVSVKLIPLLFLPLFYQYFIKEEKTTLLIRWIKLIGFYMSVCVVTLLLFSPFITSEFLHNFSKTIGLWFQNFEFNASIYYIIRWIGYQTVGWNVIGTVGKILPIITIGILLGLTFFRKSQTLPRLISTMLLGISCYYFLSTTVHPWYLAVPLILSVFTRYKFVLLWSLVIILSYTAYEHIGFKENLWMVGLEYLLVISCFIYECFQKKNADTKHILIN